MRAELRGVEEKLSAALPGARVAGYGSTGDTAFVSRDGRTAFAVAFATPDPDQPFGDNPRAERAARRALAGVTVGGAPVHLTGYDALNAQSGDSDGPGVLLEALLGGLGALVVLGFVFGSLLAFVPLMMAIPAIMTSFLAVYGLTQVTGVSPIVQFLIALVGLGVAIDFSLLIAMRWREERAHGREGDEAIVRAMETAGRAVVFSGTTVAIGLFALGRAAAAVPALGRLRRAADPGHERRGRADAAAGRAALARQTPRLAAHPHRRPGVALLDALGAQASSSTA